RDHGPASVPPRGPAGGAVLGVGEPGTRRRARGSTRRHPGSCPADALGGLRPPLQRSRGPAPGGLRLGARGPDHRALQAAEAADLPAVPAGRGCRPPLPPGGPPPVGSARGVPHPPGALPAVAVARPGTGGSTATPCLERAPAALWPPRLAQRFRILRHLSENGLFPREFLLSGSWFSQLAA